MSKILAWMWRSGNLFTAVKSENWYNHDGNQWGISLKS